MRLVATTRGRPHSGALYGGKTLRQISASQRNTTAASGTNVTSQARCRRVTLARPEPLKLVDTDRAHNLDPPNRESESHNERSKGTVPLRANDEQRHHPGRGDGNEREHFG